MQYLVKVSGNVKTTSAESEVYVVNAANEILAQEQALATFSKQKNVLDSEVVINNVSKRNIYVVIISILLMVISIILCIGFRYHEGRTIVSLQPDTVSTIFSFVLFFVYYYKFKGLQNLKNSFLEIISSFTIILLFACFFKLVLNSQDIYILKLFKVTVDTRFFLICGALLSFIGLGMSSGIMFIITLILSMFNILLFNDVLGFYGAIIIICGLFGLALNISNDPIATKMQDIINFTKGGVSKMSNRTSQTVNDIKDLSSQHNKIINADFTKAEEKDNENK